MVMITEMRELAEAMDAEGQPQPHALYQRAGGQWVADVFPLGLEGILYGGFKGELWMEPGKEPTQVQSCFVCRRYTGLAFHPCLKAWKLEACPTN